jgi:hypothetical protein
MSGAVAAAAAAQANAIKSSGVIVRVPPPVFLAILEKQNEAMLVHAQGGFLQKHERYLTSYKGLAFFTRSEQPLPIPEHVEQIEAAKLSLPD